MQSQLLCSLSYYANEILILLSCDRKGGNTVKKLTDTHKVRMSFGSWVEERNENGDTISGILIKGDIKNVKNAMDDVTNIIKSD